MNEDKSARYHRLGRRAGMFSTLWTGCVLLVLLLSGWSAELREWAVTVAGGRATPTVVLYILAVVVLLDLAVLPFGFYRSFLLERRYGLATQTLKHWCGDHLKSLLVGLAFAEAGAVFVYAALRSSPSYWWVASGIGYSIVTVILVNVAPVLLLPMFFAFRPLDRVALRERLTALASKAETRIMGVYEWTLSDRTRKANAALAGIGSTRRILLSDTLLAEYSDDEIEVILAHELAHHVHRDIWTSIGADIVLTFVAFFAAHHVLGQTALTAGLHGPADPAGIPILLITAGIVGLLVRPVTNAVSRSHERRADAYALDMTRNPSAFITAMKRLGQQNLAEENPSRLVKAFFYTHPPIRERLRAAQEWRRAS